MPHDGAGIAPNDTPPDERESHGHSADGGVASQRAILRRTKEQVGLYHQDARDARWALARALLLAPRSNVGNADTTGKQFRAARCAQVFVEHLDEAVAAHQATSWQARSARAELSRAYRLLLEDPTSQVRVYDDHLRAVLAEDGYRLIDQVRARQDLANAYADIHKFDRAIALYQDNVDHLERSERFGAHSRYSDHARRLLDWAQRSRRDVGAGRMPERRPRLRPSAHRHAVPLEDGPAMADLLGVDSDVDALGRMIAARSTQPPLAIALLAPWGGGKSTFMRLLKHKVEVELPAEDPATFHTSVDVVEFNPWHYSDTHVMVGMSRAIFESLTRYLERRGAADGESSETSWREQVEERKALTATRSRLERTQDALRTNSVVQRPRAALIALRTLPDLVLGRNHKVMRILVMFSAASFLLALAAVLGWETWGLDVGARVRAWADVVLRSAPALLVLSTVGAAVLEGVPKAAAIQRKVRSGASWLVGFVAAGVDAEIGRIDERLQQTEARPTTAAVADLETILNDPERAAERDVQRGVVGVLQTQFEELAEAYGLGRDGALGTQVAADDLRIRRIVLHVDDLDRCRPERVVEVLHTLNLLQATRLFVAVVSVDPRWLRRSLSELDPTRPGDPDASEVSGRLREGIGDPLDFLDKIIQIPYALRPMSAANAEEYFSRLVRSHDLDDPRIEEPDSAVPTGTTTAPPAAPEHLDQRRPALQLTVTPREWDYLRPLAAAQQTPRAVKRFLNLYQLLRLTSGLGMEEEEGILGDDVHAARRAAATLLAVLVGAPRQATELLAEMLSADTQEHTLDALVDDLQSRHLHDPNGPHPHRRRAAGRCDVCVGWRRIRDVVQPSGTADGAAEESLRVGDFRPWVGEVARFSFHSEAMGLAGVVASSR